MNYWCDPGAYVVRHQYVHQLFKVLVIIQVITTGSTKAPMSRPMQQFSESRTLLEISCVDHISSVSADAT